MNSQHNNALPEHTSTSGGQVEAPGMTAISNALSTLYQGRRPLHFENPHPLSLGGDDPLDGISVYQRAEPEAHWHYVTYGFSELFAKETANPAVSGFGFELSFRVAAAPGASEPPLWPMHLLQSLGRYVFRTRNGFHEGHRISTNGPISLGSPTALRTVAFAFDPELPPIATPFGHVAFLQVVGLTDDEERVAQRWETRKLLDALLPHLPLWITPLPRPSMLDKPDVAAAVAEGIARDGSSSVAIYADVLDIEAHRRFLRKPEISIVLGARQIGQLIELLPLRLPFKRPLTVSGPAWKLHFEPARRNAAKLSRGALHICVNDSGARELATLLQAKQGVYKLPSLQNVLWDIKQTWIRNAEGELVDVIG
jgi:suppressor of fused-like protein